MTRNALGKARRFVTRSLAVAALLGAYCIATLGVMSMMVATTDIAAQARGAGGPRGGRGGGVVRGGRGVRGGPVFRGRGRGAHFWHGRWWGYGVGPCWRLVGPVWVWICD